MSDSTQRAYWRSLEQRAATDTPQPAPDASELELPPVVFNQVTRRNFLGIMGASMALAGLAGWGEILGLHFRLIEEISRGLGTMGVVAALVGLVLKALFADGRLVWKFRGGPTNRNVLRNERLISTWPVRGGPVLLDGTIYFSAGIWPFMGTFIYALDVIFIYFGSGMIDALQGVDRIRIRPVRTTSIAIIRIHYPQISSHVYWKTGMGKSGSAP